MLPKVNSSSPINGVTFLSLVSRMQQINFYVTVSRSLENYVHSDMPGIPQRALEIKLARKKIFEKFFFGLSDVKKHKKYWCQVSGRSAIILTPEWPKIRFWAYFQTLIGHFIILSINQKVLYPSDSE